MIIVDGPMGTALAANGVDTKLPLWSAAALVDCPSRVAAVHRAEASAGATVHCTNTFRVQPRSFPHSYIERVTQAVSIARASIASTHRVAGSIAPLADCYRPDLSEGAKADHRPLATALANAGCDILLCETFPHVEEGLAALAAARGTGKETWLSFTAGPDGDLMTPRALSRAAERAAIAGAGAVLINCVAATRTTPFVAALRDALGDALPFGAYGNAGTIDDGVGWTSAPDPGPAAYAEIAARWVDLGATLIGSCCGTSSAHTAALAKRFT